MASVRKDRILTGALAALIMTLSVETFHAALRDPEYHRHVIFGHIDRTMAERLGRPLEAHETQGKIPWPQLEIVRRVERAIADAAGEVITVRTARQTGKNETEAFLEARALSVFARIPGRVWVRTAPTYRPQIVNSKLRLEKFTAADPFLRGRTRNREGFIVQNGYAQVQFLSGGEASNVIGATASIALSVDEAHVMDAGKFEEELGPFTARTNAPTVMWGVAADRLDLLQEYVDLNQDTDRNLEFPAPIWCELSKAYAAHYEGRRAKLGATHPVILTQYDLVPVDAIGGYLNAVQRAALFSGDHPRLSAPREGMNYSIAIDIGGESEADSSDADVRLEEPGRDYTMAWILEWNPRAPAKPYVDVRVVDGVWYVGRRHMDVLPDLLSIIRHWGIRAGAVDARGVGEAVAMAIQRTVPAIKAYKASHIDVSDDCYDLLARVNTGRVKFWKADPAGDAELREVMAQARHTRYEIHGHELMRLIKPTGAGSTGLHIDGVKALTYLHRAVRTPHAGLMSYTERKADEAKTPKTVVPVDPNAPPPHEEPVLIRRS